MGPQRIDSADRPSSLRPRPCSAGGVRAIGVFVRTENICLAVTTECRSLPDTHFGSGSFRCEPHCVPTTASPDRLGIRLAGLRPFAKMQPSLARSSHEKTALLR